MSLRAEVAARVRAALWALRTAAQHCPVCGAPAGGLDTGLGSAK